MSFKVGDKVQLKSSSAYYDTQGFDSSGKLRVFTVMNGDSSSGYQCETEDGYKNAYEDYDLVHFKESKKMVKEHY